MSNCQDGKCEVSDEGGRKRQKLERLLEAAKKVSKLETKSKDRVG